jgi:Vault protein inter-alpha-trypsin domain
MKAPPQSTLLHLGLLALAAVLSSCASGPGSRLPIEIPQPPESSATNSAYPNGPPAFDANELWIIARAPDRGGAPNGSAPEPGALVARVGGRQLALPLKHTDVAASVNGCAASVRVSQQFENPYGQRTEAVYTFPLPHNAAVDEFIMTIGDRRIRGIVRERADAELIYQEARRQGYTASLLTEERPNLFTQSIANISPGREIDVDIQYFQTLAYVDGWCEFVFPLAPKSRHADARDLALRVDVDAGAPIENYECRSHDVTAEKPSPERLTVQLKSGNVPDQDFVLRYRVAGDAIKSALLTQKDDTGGYFNLMLYPPRKAGDITRPALTGIQIDWGGLRVSEVYPREIPDLLMGRPIVLAGRFTGHADAPIRVTGNLAGKTVQLEIPVRDAPAISGRLTLPALWARLKLAGLEAQLGPVPDPKIIDEIQHVARDYGLLSPGTAFITVDSTQPKENQ